MIARNEPAHAPGLLGLDKAVDRALAHERAANARDDVYASPQNAMIFRAAFGAMPRVVDELFAMLRYTERTEWPMSAGRRSRKVVKGRATADQG